MTYNPTRETLELAALAGGKEVSTDKYFGDVLHVWHDAETGMCGMWIIWQPHLPTTQGKADLLDLMLATSISWEDGTDYMYADRFGDFPKKVKITNGDKHAALMEAALEVAAQVGAKMKGTPC